MAIIKWNPYKSMEHMKENFNGILENKSLKMKYYSMETIPYGNWMPNVDIFEDEEKILIKVDLPEVDEKDINIKVENSSLIFKGERKFVPEISIENYKRIECPYGSFTREFAVPSNINVNGIKAKLSDGVLRIILPKNK